jgi:hypothetical protein
LQKAARFLRGDWAQLVCEENPDLIEGAQKVPSLWQVPGSEQSAVPVTFSVGKRE